MSDCAKEVKSSSMRPIHKSAVMPMRMLYRGIQESGFSLDEIGERSGVSPTTMEKWFYCGRPPTLRNFMAVAEAVCLKVTLDYDKQLRKEQSDD